MPDTKHLLTKSFLSFVICNITILSSSASYINRHAALVTCISYFWGPHVGYFGNPAIGGHLKGENHLKKGLYCICLSHFKVYNYIVWKTEYYLKWHFSNSRSVSLSSRTIILMEEGKLINTRKQICFGNIVLWTSTTKRAQSNQGCQFVS